MKWSQDEAVWLLKISGHDVQSKVIEYYPYKGSLRICSAVDYLMKVHGYTKIVKH